MTKIRGDNGDEGHEGRGGRERSEDTRHYTKGGGRHLDQKRARWLSRRTAGLISLLSALPQIRIYGRLYR